MNKSHNILLIEPSPIIAKGVVSLMATSKLYVIASTLTDLSSYSPINYLHCDIVIINPIVVGFDQRYNIRSILSPDDSKSIILLSSTPIEESLSSQYDGFINIYSSAEEIDKIITNVADNVKLVAKDKSLLLSSREKSILAAVTKGKTNKEIADDFNISIFTVMTHRKNISHKLGINSIAGLTVYAILNNLIEMTDI